MNEEQSAWLGVVGGSVLTVLGLRRGGAIGSALAVTGIGVLLGGVRQLGVADDFHRPRQPMPPAFDPGDFPEPKDRVQEASEESFPASDPPAHTSTTGIGFT